MLVELLHRLVILLPLLLDLPPLLLGLILQELDLFLKVLALSTDNMLFLNIFVDDRCMLVVHVLKLIIE